MLFFLLYILPFLPILFILYLWVRFIVRIWRRVGIPHGIISIFFFPYLVGVGWWKREEIERTGTLIFFTIFLVLGLAGMIFGPDVKQLQKALSDAEQPSQQMARQGAAVQAAKTSPPQSPAARATAPQATAQIDPQIGLKGFGQIGDRVFPLLAQTPLPQN